VSSAPAAPARPRSLLAFDYGTRRIGVASGNSLTRTATPLTTVDATSSEERWRMVAAILTQWQPDALVVGIPRHPDGTPHENTHRAQRFARQLAGRFRLTVHEVDERYTSVEAQSLGARDVDAAAAALILEQYLRHDS
jgi:putative Holliday junction resolvase